MGSKSLMQSIEPVYTDCRIKLRLVVWTACTPWASSESNVCSSSRRARVPACACARARVSVGERVARWDAFIRRVTSFLRLDTTPWVFNWATGWNGTLDVMGTSWCEETPCGVARSGNLIAKSAVLNYHLMQGCQTYWSWSSQKMGSRYRCHSEPANE